jgi:hypothetical protein
MKTSTQRNLSLYPSYKFMPDPRTLPVRSSSQTQANRFAFLIRTANAKLVEKIRRT